MATKLPRVMITVTEEQHSILSRMAVIQRRPVSSFIRELLDAAMPVLRASLPILEARERALEEQPAAVAKAAEGLLQAFQGIDPDQLSLLIDDDDLQHLAAAAVPTSDAREPLAETEARGPQRKRGPHAPPRPRKSRTVRDRLQK